MDNNEKPINIGIEIKADLEPVLTSTPAGIRYIFNLLFGRKHAEAERALKLTDAQNNIDIKRIMSGAASYDIASGRLVEKRAEEENPRSLIARAMQEDEVSNLIDCSIQAASHISNQHSLDPPSDLNDFINRWKSEAKLVSTEAAQAIWGRVLAEEINEPGSISLRTMDVIKNLSRTEATNFNKICKFVLFDTLVADNGEYSAITREEFSSVLDAGLIANFTPGMYRSSSWPETTMEKSSEVTLDVFYVRCGRMFIFVEKGQATGDHSTKPNFAYWELTKAGRELYKVVRDTLDVEIEEVVRSLFKGDDALVNRVQFTEYTNVDERQVDMASIRGL